MINIIPQTEVRLLKTKLEKDSEHTLSWNNINSQTSYFLNNTIKVYNEFTYQKENSSLVVPDNYDTIYTCNYLMYKNNGFNSKYFYAFITKMEYVSENSTRIYFEIDSLQTWYFNINYNQCFIEREHVNDDTVGLNLVPEGLETGEYVCNNKNIIQYMSERCIPCMAVTTKPYNPLLEDPDPPLFQPYGGIFSGTKYLISDTVEHFGELLQYYNALGIVDTAISYIFMIPEFYKTITTIESHIFALHEYFWGEIPTSDAPYGYSTSGFSKLTALDGYTPKNKKLLTYPYCFINVDNNGGNVVQLHYEDFTSVTYNFNIETILTPGCSTKITPANYKLTADENYLYSFNACKLPICSYGSDVYTNWLTQNGVNIATDVIESGVTSAVTGNPTNLVMSVFSNLAESMRVQKIPNSVKGNVNSGDIVYSMGIFHPICYDMSIKAVNAKIIDDYFSMYGYKVNALKTPNIKGRRNWNYVKTVGCNFTGDIPQEDLEKIKNIFNNGITFWHNSNNFLNYSVNNDII